MLAITFETGSEWWVSGKTFERLFRSALDAGDLSASAEEWLHVADANGGLDLGLLDPAAAATLVFGLRRAAARDVRRFGEDAPATDDGGYAVSLRRFIDATDPAPPR